MPVTAEPETSGTWPSLTNIAMCPSAAARSHQVVELGAAVGMRAMRPIGVTQARIA